MSSTLRSKKMQNISSSFIQTNARICIVIKQHRKLVHISLLTKEKASSTPLAAQSQKQNIFYKKKEKSQMILARKTLSIIRNTIFLRILECTASKLQNVGHISVKVSIILHPRHHRLKMTKSEFSVLIKFLRHCPFNHGQRGDHTETTRLILKVEL